MKRALCWIRRDLRLEDHTALAEATRQAERVAVAFVFDTNILDKLADRSDRRVTFIERSLRELDGKLRARGSALLVRAGDPVVEIPKLARELGAEAVFAARDHEGYALARDAQVANAVDLRMFKDQVVLEGAEIAKPYRVFTPYSRAWLAKLDPVENLADRTANLQRFWPLSELGDSVHEWSLERLGFLSSEIWLVPGEDAARARLAAFEPAIGRYGAVRDFPAEEGTSGLSVHLRFGTISCRACFRAAFAAGDDGGKWLSELVWREFYQAILEWFPQVESQPFQAHYTDLVWPGEDEHFQAWCAGQTGYPIVDAAMRCLNATGWMHNRLRMVVASFLTKDLLVSYTKGEAYFAEKLLDFDVASNNGGWQWAASTGCDAQPYFRIFNPFLQSQKFDPEGIFLKRWLPEIASLQGKALHFPASASAFDLLAQGVELGVTYPAPIVDHQTQKALALALFA